MGQHKLVARLSWGAFNNASRAPKLSVATITRISMDIFRACYIISYIHNTQNEYHKLLWYDCHMYEYDATLTMSDIYCTHVHMCRVGCIHGYGASRHRNTHQ